MLAGPIVLMAGALLRRARYIVWAIGAAMSLWWIFTTESRAFRNSWVAMNVPPQYGDTRYIRYFQLRVVAVAFLLATLTLVATRLLPSDWQLRHQPMRERTWPAIVLSLILVACWFAKFAFPYRQPIIVDAEPPELSVLHVVKDGVAFHETRVSIYRDGRYYLVRGDRRLLHYSFGETMQEGVLTEDIRSKLSALEALPDLTQTAHTAPHALRCWHGEGWYTKADSFEITAFTTENATPAPADLIAYFHQIESSPSTGGGWSDKVRDVCLGFCYDPKAGLGDRAENQRCRFGIDGREEYCY